MENLSRAYNLIKQPEFSQFTPIYSADADGKFMEIRLGRKQLIIPKKGLSKIFGTSDVFVPTIAIFRLKEDDKGVITTRLHLFGTKEENELVIKFFDLLFPNWVSEHGKYPLAVDANILTPDEIQFYYYSENPTMRQEE